jgi:hypothetical protein
MDMYPHLTHFPENRLALERQRQLRREIRARKDAARTGRSFRFAALAARWRPALRPRPARCVVGGQCEAV